MDNPIIITVGRQFGSGGKLLACELGKRLSIPVYDKELITAAAEKSGICEEFFEKRDEKRRTLYIGMRSGMDDEMLFRIQSEAIREIAAKGSAIFVGRASDYVLRDMDCLDIFISAPFEERVKRVCEREGMSEKAARTFVQKQDKGREDYYNFFTFTRWGNAANYDLCIDSSILGIEGTADLVIDFLKKKGTI